MRISDWISDVCSSDLAELAKGGGQCTWSKKDVANGKIDVAGTCTQNGQTVDMAMVGTMAAKKTDVTRSEERLGGKECESKGRSRGLSSHKKQKMNKQMLYSTLTKH